MASMGHQTAEQLAEDLATQLVPYCTQPVDLVLENDLAGRAILAACWPARHKLTVYLLTDVPEADSTQKLIAGLLDVTNPPVVHSITPDDDAVRLIDAGQPLIWAVLPNRTDSAARAALQRRSARSVSDPWSDTRIALEADTIEPSFPDHERVLRDVIGYHAPLLNFFGDRHNPQDLYERTRYPRWFTPPPGFTGGLPQLRCNRAVFDGVLTVESTEPVKDAADRATAQAEATNSIDFSPVLEVLGRICDLTLHLSPDSVQAGRVQIYRGAVRVHDSRGEAWVPLSLPLAEVQPGTNIRVVLTGPADTALGVQLALHEPGTHPRPGLVQRLRNRLGDRFSPKITGAE